MPAISGRCYCGAVSIAATKPVTTVYCHCVDCRRWTGAALSAFVAFRASEVTLMPAQGDGVSTNPGVQRWNCQTCGSPLMARFDYLPDQSYVPIGLLDQIDILQPSLHCHAGNCPPWLHIHDDLPREASTGRDILNAES